MSAGSAKTEAIVMDQLRHVNDPKFESVTFRKNNSSLIGAGGIFHKAGNLYLPLGATQTRSNQNLKYTFPSGATARYSHLDGGKVTAESNHAGLEYSAIECMWLYIEICIEKLGELFWKP